MDHAPTVFRGPETEEQFLADRQRFWFGFTRFTVTVVCVVVLVLILMTVFLV